MTIKERIQTVVRKLLKIQPAAPQSITIQEILDRRTRALLHQIWYRGDPEELDQTYKQISNGTAYSTMFWAASPETQMIRKIHSGVPALMINALSYIVSSDMDDPDFDNAADKSTWEQIIKPNVFKAVVSSSVVGTLVSGDGAYKISIDTDVSPYPIVEFVAGENVEYITQHGQIIGSDFYSDRTVGNQIYTLREEYRKNKVSYALLDDKGNEVPLDRDPDLINLKPVTFSGDYVMAVPVKFYDNPRYAGRGQSIYESKVGVFDAHDEVISQWLDAIRAGRVVKYIPESMIPQDPHGKGPLMPSDFGSHYIKVQTPNLEGMSAPKIDISQPEIKYDAFESSYSNTLNMCLQGIVSPATLGIDVGKMSSADAQREKKDITGNTRNLITGVLEDVLVNLVDVVLKAYDSLQSQAVQEHGVTVSFGEYGAPDFDSRVATVGNAATTGIMSIDAQVNELWGGSKDDTWIEQEVTRIKAEKGMEVEPPKVGVDMP